MVIETLIGSLGRLRGIHVFGTFAGCRLYGFWDDLEVCSSTAEGSCVSEECAAEHWCVCLMCRLYELESQEDW